MLPHWKHVLRCCVIFPCINLLDQETDNQYSDTTPSIGFHIYHIIAGCTVHGRITLKDKTVFRICKQQSSSDESSKIYTRKELVMMETTICDFNTSFYIPSIQRLPFYLPNVHILGTNYCGSCNAQPSNVANYFKMFYVFVIMLKG